MFPEAPAMAGQLQRWQPSAFGSAELRWRSADDRHQILVEPFFRLDGQDDERTHADLREAYYRYVGDGDWSLLIGVAKIFWGVAESRHLVDIINQTDVVEDVDEEDKLGQPMAQLVLQSNWGQLDLFVLPGFRRRPFAGSMGRLRTPVVVDADDPRYEADAGAGHVDLAARYSSYFGEWDVGLGAFRGTSREPRLAFDPAASRLTPIYDEITQFGADIQYTHGAWLLKFEGAWREARGRSFFATVSGVEYTMFQIAGTSFDLGLIAEYQHDGRAAAALRAEVVGPFETAAPPTLADNDVFAGLRLAFNDVQDASLLVGAAVDVEDGSSLIIVEGERRLGTGWTIELEARFFANVSDQNFARLFAEDDFITLRFTRRF